MEATHDLHLPRPRAETFSQETVIEATAIEVTAIEASIIDRILPAIEAKILDRRFNCLLSYHQKPGVLLFFLSFSPDAVRKVGSLRGDP
jgi:hypothetical protein